MSSRTDAQAEFNGPERRRHVLFRTRNTEYHLRDARCVAVRDPKSHRFIQDHPAVGRRLSGAIRFSDGGQVSKFVLPGEMPEVGDILFFSEGRLETELRTTAVRDIERPPKEAVSHYLH